jgi:hypothetical protein
MMLELTASFETRRNIRQMTENCNEVRKTKEGISRTVGWKDKEKQCVEWHSHNSIYLSADFANL